MRRPRCRSATRLYVRRPAFARQPSARRNPPRRYQFNPRHVAPAAHAADLRLRQRHPARGSSRHHRSPQSMARRRSTARQPHLLAPFAQRAHRRRVRSRHREERADPRIADGRPGLALVPLSVPLGRRHHRKTPRRPRLSRAARISDRARLAGLRGLPLERPLRALHGKARRQNRSSICGPAISPPPISTSPSSAKPRTRSTAATSHTSC